jgi:hypothetical protein
MNQDPIWGTCHHDNLTVAIDDALNEKSALSLPYRRIIHGRGATFGNTSPFTGDEYAPHRRGILGTEIWGTEIWQAPPAAACRLPTHRGTPPHVQSNRYENSKTGDDATMQPPPYPGMLSLVQPVKPQCRWPARCYNRRPTHERRSFHY